MNGAQLFEQMSSRIKGLDSEIDQLNRQISEGLLQIDTQAKAWAKEILQQQANTPQVTAAGLEKFSESLQVRSKNIETTRAETQALQQQLQQAQSQLSNAQQNHQNANNEAEQFKNNVLTTFWSSSENAEIKNQLSGQEKIFEAATERAQKAAQEKSAKALAYTNDPIFNYLHQRKFGTAAYLARGFIQRMDRWVAAISHYQDASHNFEILTQLPQFLQKHADDISIQLNALKKQVTAMERTALDQAQFAPYEAKVDQTKNEVTKVATFVSETQEKLQQHQQLAQQYATFQDPTAQRVVDHLATQYKNNASAEIRQKQETVSQLVQERNSKSTLREQLQQAQINFSNAGYNSPTVIYRGGTDPGALLTGLLLGQLTFDIFERSMLGGFTPGGYDSSWIGNDPIGGSNFSGDDGGSFGGDSGGGGFDGGSSFGGDSGGGGFDNNSGF